MNDRMPPLTALRAFEAAARHMSFSRAADELHVTPAALSFQIKSLEDHLGHPVFRRLNRAVELTEAGRALLPGVADGFAALNAAWRTARRFTDATSLTVTAGPAFTAKWLAPRLFDFAAKHPDIELRFSASLRLMDFGRDEIDVAIRFGIGPDDGLFSRPLMREWVTPMMTPELAQTVQTPVDLAGVTLFHQDDIRHVAPGVSWKTWLDAAGLPGMDPVGPRFSQADHAVDAALSGAGVVLGRISLTAPALREGRLVAPFPVALTTPAHYRFLCPAGSETRPPIAAFHDWITAETAQIALFETGRTFVPADGPKATTPA